MCVDDLERFTEEQQDEIIDIVCDPAKRPSADDVDEDDEGGDDDGDDNNNNNDAVAVDED